MRFALTFLLTVIGVFAQASTPVFFNVGPLLCGARVYAPGKVQKWCYLSQPPAPIDLVCNSADRIVPLAPGPLPISGFHFCGASDPVSGNNYSAGFAAWQPIVALPPNSTGTIVYQAVTWQAPCTVNANGACVSSSAGTETFTTGSFSSGVVVAGLTTFQTDGQAPVIVDVEPNAQWNVAFGPGTAVISTSGMAQAITPSGLCTLTSSDPGTAGFSVDAGGASRVDWLPDGWCPSGFTGFNKPTLSGNCTSLDLTFILQAEGRCAAVPVEPVTSVAQAHLRFQALEPTVQGR